MKEKNNLCEKRTESDDSIEPGDFNRINIEPHPLLPVFDFELSALAVRNCSFLLNGRLASIMFFFAL